MRDRSSDPAPEPWTRQPPSFTTTHWSVVLRAGVTDSPTAAQALDQLCRTYWYPLYAFVRRKGYSPHDAQDLTQAFFARLLGCVIRSMWQAVRATNAEQAVIGRRKTPWTGDTTDPGSRPRRQTGPGQNKQLA